MMITFLIILFSTTFVQLPLLVGNGLLRTDCYISFSIPVIFINVSHFNPSGPPYIGATFIYKRYSLLPGHDPQIINAEYDFKKYDSPCQSSALLTTMGNDFDKFDVNITVYLFKYEYKMGFIQYTFHKGFTSGVYELFDYYQNFAIKLKVFDVSENYLGTQTRSDEMVESFLSSIKGKNGQICLITENNKAAVLNPKYESEAPSGFIFAFAVAIRKYGILNGKHEYPAFECYLHKKYNKKPVVFITAGKKYETSFSVYYWKYYDGIPKFQWQSFHASNQKYDYIQNFERLSKKYTKVLLIELTSYIIQCPDKSEIKILVSKDGIKYFATITKNVSVSTQVELYRNFYRSPLNPCVETKK